MRKILVLHTGGTISMTADESGAVAPSTTNPLLAAGMHLDSDIELEVEEIFNLPSPHVTPAKMLVLAKRIRRAQMAGVTGVVVTHGTDTLEETAYFLDLTLDPQIPVVVTGAMRSSNEIGSDGVYNYQSAIKVAASAGARGKGCLVVMNDEIHTARFVTKTHTTNVATFRTPTFGPVGLVTKDGARFFQELINQEPAQSTRSMRTWCLSRRTREWTALYLTFCPIQWTAWLLKPWVRVTCRQRPCRQSRSSWTGTCRWYLCPGVSTGSPSRCTITLVAGFRFRSKA